VAALVQYPQHHPAVRGQHRERRSHVGHPRRGRRGNLHNYVAHGYFAYAALNFTDTTALDHGLATELHRNPGYRTVSVVPYGTEVRPVGLGTYVIWKYEPHR
jgi:hypothetical protein